MIKIKRYMILLITFICIAFTVLMLLGIVSSTFNARNSKIAFTDNNSLIFSAHALDGTLRQICDTLIQTFNCKSLLKVFYYAEVYALWESKPGELNIPVLCGEFFDESSMNSQQPLAVIGKERYKTSTEKLNGNNVIYFNTKPYLVIGVIGYANKTSIYDDMCLINLSSLLFYNAYSSDGEYIVNSSFDENVSNTTLLDVLDKYTTEHTIISNKENVDFSQHLDSLLEDGEFRNMIIITTLMIICTLFSICTEWIRKREDEFRIMRIIGFTRTSVVLHVYIQFVIVNLIALCIAFPAYLSLHTHLMEALNYPISLTSSLDIVHMLFICSGFCLFGCIPVAFTYSELKVR